MGLGSSRPWTRAPRKEAIARRAKVEHQRFVRQRLVVAERRRRAMIMAHSMASRASVALVVSSVGEFVRSIGLVQGGAALSFRVTFAGRRASSRNLVKSAQEVLFQYVRPDAPEQPCTGHRGVAGNGGCLWCGQPQSRPCSRPG